VSVSSRFFKIAPRHFFFKVSVLLRDARCHPWGIRGGDTLATYSSAFSMPCEDINVFMALFEDELQKKSGRLIAIWQVL